MNNWLPGALYSGEMEFRRVLYTGEFTEIDSKDNISPEILNNLARIRSWVDKTPKEKTSWV